MSVQQIFKAALLLIAIQLTACPGWSASLKKKIWISCDPVMAPVEGTLTTEFDTSKWPMSCSNEQAPRSPIEAFAIAVVNPPSIRMEFASVNADADRNSQYFSFANRDGLKMYDRSGAPPT